MPAASGNLLDFVQALRERGYIHQVSDEDGLRALAAKGPVTAYIGFDCTAPSLHVGNLIGIMMLRVLQRCGHRPIALSAAARRRSAIHRARTKAASF